VGLSPWYSLALTTAQAAQQQQHHHHGLHRVEPALQLTRAAWLQGGLWRASQKPGLHRTCGLPWSTSSESAACKWHRRCQLLLLLLLPLLLLLLLLLQVHYPLLPAPCSS
jgi:hypothetical protein